MHKPERVWTTENGIKWHIPLTFQYNLSVAFFGLEDVLVVIGEGNLFKIQEGALEKLRHIHEHGSSVCILSNQNKKTVEQAVSMYGFLADKTNVPIAVIFSITQNFYRKPMTGMMKFMEEKYRMTIKEGISRTNSIFVGRAGGQASGKTKLTPRTRVRNDYDRAFASNVGILYVEPEFFFGIYPTSSAWKWSEKVISPEKRMELMAGNSPKGQIKDMIIELLPKMNRALIHLVLLVGPPCCGKTTVAKTLLRGTFEEKCVIVDNHEKKYIEEIKSRLEEGTAVIVDRRAMEINAEREKIITSCRIAGAIIFIVDMILPTETCILMDFIRVQTSEDPTIELTPESTFKSYVKKYEEPKYGDSKIITVIKYHVPLPSDSIKDGMLRFSVSK